MTLVDINTCTIKGSVVTVLGVQREIQLDMKMMQYMIEEVYLNLSIFVLSWESIDRVSDCRHNSKPNRHATLE